MTLQVQFLYRDGESAVLPWQRWTLLGSPLSDDAFGYDPTTGRVQPWRQLDAKLAETTFTFSLVYFIWLFLSLFFCWRKFEHQLRLQSWKRLLRRTGGGGWRRSGRGARQRTRRRQLPRRGRAGDELIT